MRCATNQGLLLNFVPFWGRRAIVREFLVIWFFLNLTFLCKDTFKIVIMFWCLKMPKNWLHLNLAQSASWTKFKQSQFLGIAEKSRHHLSHKSFFSALHQYKWEELFLQCCSMCNESYYNFNVHRLFFECWLGAFCAPMQASPSIEHDENMVGHKALK